MHHLDGVVATFPDLLVPIDGQAGNVHAVAVAALVKLLARLELLKSRTGQQGILRSVRRQIPSWYRTDRNGAPKKRALDSTSKYREIGRDGVIQNVMPKSLPSLSYPSFLPVHAVSLS